MLSSSPFGEEDYPSLNAIRHKTLYGYFEMPTEVLKVLNHETCYRLVLTDGRKANIYIEIVPSREPGKSVAEFHVSGGLKK
ncbi:MAG: hypothetical protein ACM3VW_04730 [Bacteroidota bacterium]